MDERQGRRQLAPDGAETAVGAGLLALVCLGVAAFGHPYLALGFVLFFLAVEAVAVVIALVVTRSLRRALYEGPRWTIGFLFNWIS